MGIIVVVFPLWWQYCYVMHLHSYSLYCLLCRLVDSGIKLWCFSESLPSLSVNNER